jgi:hypothetical protein
LIAAINYRVGVLTDENEDVSCAIRALLRERGALLTHFSTVMADPASLFPHDLLNALALRGNKLSFSTILLGDRNPHADGHGAEGSVGMVVDLGTNTVIESVHHADSGSSSSGSLGLPPTLENAAASIDRRRTSNEWELRNYIPVGILILEPVFVRKAFILDGHKPVEVEFNQEAYRAGTQILQEGKISLEEAVGHFGTERIFKMSENGFLEFDRRSSDWRPVSYGAIIPPCTVPHNAQA